MQHVGRASDSFIPTRIRLQIGFGELELGHVGMLRERFLYFARPAERPERPTHPVAGIEQLDGTMVCNEARDACDENRIAIHFHAPAFIEASGLRREALAYWPSIRSSARDASAALP